MYALRIPTRLLLAALLFLSLPFSSHAYSVLTHEALVDANWERTIEPLLRQRYPNATADELKKARSFAYGGAVSPDMGYYPFGAKLFTNLVHYVRSGDFVQALLDGEHNVNEFAFALGTLCHYMADTYGHPLGTNRSVPVVYPKTGKKFGPVVTYAQDKVAHLRVEFGFDVLQTARGDYASADYHNYIGFNVADTLLDSAFRKTYGLGLHDVFPNFPLALSTFRWTVKSFFPELTRAAWVMKKGEIRKNHPGIASRHFIYHMHRKQYFQEFGKAREKPGVFANVLSFMIRIMPKVGPLRALKFKVPDQKAELYFVQSFDSVVLHYGSFVQAGLPLKQLTDRDFDTGKSTEPGEYPLCDDAYRALLLELEKKKFTSVDMSLRQNILSFYANPESLSHAGKHSKEISEALEKLTTGNSEKVKEKESGYQQ